MRVLHVFKDYYPPTRGGIEQHIHDVVHDLDGYELSVLTSSRSRERVVSDEDGVAVTRIPEWARVASAPVQPTLASELRRAGADVVHVHLPNPSAEMAVLAARLRVPVVASFHAENPRSAASAAGTALRRLAGPVYEPVQQRFLARCARIVVGSPPMADAPALRRHRDRVAVVPYGVDPDAWASRPAKADDIRDRYPGPLVLFLGRRVHYKGLAVLAKAMAGAEATCLVVGDGPVPVDPPLVHIEAVPDDLRAAYYHAAEVFALPSTSRAETFGISMLEAMATGTPAVSTELGTGTSWLNRHEETGLVVPPGDPRALAAAVNRMLADDDLRRRMGESARARAATFSRRAMLDGLAAVYRSVA